MECTNQIRLINYNYGIGCKFINILYVLLMVLVERNMLKMTDPFFKVGRQTFRFFLKLTAANKNF